MVVAALRSCSRRPCAYRLYLNTGVEDVEAMASVLSGALDDEGAGRRGPHGRTRGTKPDAMRSESEKSKNRCGNPRNQTSWERRFLVPGCSESEKPNLTRGTISDLISFPYLLKAFMRMGSCSQNYAEAIKKRSLQERISWEISFDRI